MEISDQWVFQAERDLRAAYVLGGHQLFDWSVYAAQQAAEKAIKAVRYALGIDRGPSTDAKSASQLAAMLHDLSKLAEPLHTLLPRFPASPDELMRLTTYESDGRYPLPTKLRHYLAAGRRVEVKDALVAHVIATRVVTFCCGTTRELQQFWAARALDGAGALG